MVTSLSAIGSKIAPKLDCHLNFLATFPSKKSVQKANKAKKKTFPNKTYF